MKVIIAGSRSIIDYNLIQTAIDESYFTVTEVVCGGASGVDELGRQWARNNGVKCSLFPAEWGKYKRAAGPLRNRTMAAYADALIAIWDGKSRGTKNMISEMQGLNKPVYVEII